MLSLLSLVRLYLEANTEGEMFDHVDKVEQFPGSKVCAKVNNGLFKRKLNIKVTVGTLKDILHYCCLLYTSRCV